ncbi:MAG: hypothetical protein EOS11_15440 [Mesorhizobium sp.]|nr:MAG: hypothetical protein EOS11_15440 [Mesorhizobium sp.]
MVLISWQSPLKGLDCTPRYLNMSGRGVDFSLARLNAPNAGFPCFGIGDKPALILKLLAKFFSESLHWSFVAGIGFRPIWQRTLGTNLRPDPLTFPKDMMPAPGPVAAFCEKPSGLAPA